MHELHPYLAACVEADGDPKAIPPVPWEGWAEPNSDAINFGSERTCGPVARTGRDGDAAGDRRRVAVAVKLTARL